VNALVPTLDYCDLCSAPQWRVFLIEIPKEILGPRMLAAVSTRPTRLALTVPLCEPCADLLGVADLKHVDSVGEMLEQPFSAGGAVFQDALVRLLRRYEAERVPQVDRPHA
jgi:hypothetical protein